MLDKNCTLKLLFETGSFFLRNSIKATTKFHVLMLRFVLFILDSFVNLVNICLDF